MGSSDVVHPHATSPSAEDERPKLEPGRNCWRIAQAGKAKLIIDANDYFIAARAAMLKARRRIMLIGWDFDARIHLAPDGRDKSDPPVRVGDFLLWLAQRNQNLEIYVLRWDFGALKSLFRGSTVISIARWAMHRRIHLRLDSAHPPGAAHHQKIVVVDDSIAFCGGIDMTSGRWDTSEHLIEDPRRKWPDRDPWCPWHDAIMAVDGDAAGALAKLARHRWQCAGGSKLEAVSRGADCWPEEILAPDFRDVQVAISRTRPRHSGVEACYEIEALYLDHIRRARRFIYAESQYFASSRIAEALASRLDEAGGPEVVLINPKEAEGWLEREAMDTARSRIWESLSRCRGAERLRIYHPVAERGIPIYVHAKILVVDDAVLRVGSSNWNNRSMRLDTECDLTIDATLEGNAEARRVICALRSRLLAEHLDVSPQDVERSFATTESLITTIEQLRTPGRSLVPFVPSELNPIEKAIADNETLDPEEAGDMFEPFQRKSLLQQLRHRRRPN